VAYLSACVCLCRASVCVLKCCLAVSRCYLSESRGCLSVCVTALLSVCACVTGLAVCHCCLCVMAMSSVSGIYVCVAVLSVCCLVCVTVMFDYVKVHICVTSATCVSMSWHCLSHGAVSVYGAACVTVLAVSMPHSVCLCLSVSQEIMPVCFAVPSVHLCDGTNRLKVSWWWYVCLSR
jgi:hypothetical protein